MLLNFTDKLKEYIKNFCKVEVDAWTHTKSPITREQWRLHLEGVEPQLGIAPLKKDGTCKWGAIDIDINNYDYQGLLNKIRKLNLPLIMFRSKSGRAHVYMFMKTFHDAQEVKLVMEKFAAKIGVADILDRVYPMQTNLKNNSFGSWLNMPILMRSVALLHTQIILKTHP